MSSGSVFVQDTFTDTAGDNLVTQHTGEIGGTWAVQPGGSGSEVLQISTSGKVYSSGVFGQLYASGVPDSPDYDVDYDFTLLTDLQAFGGCARMDTASNTSYMSGLSGARLLSLYQVVSGSFTLLGSVDLSGTVSLGTTHHLRQRAYKSGEKSLWFDGQVLINANDEVITAAGRAGLNFGGGSSDTTGYHIDNFVATNGRQFLLTR